MKSRRTILNYWIVVHLVTALNGYPINESIAESEADYSEFAHDANSTTTVSPHDEALAALCRSKNSTFPGSRFGITDCLPCARICDSNDHYDQISCAAVRADGFCLPTTANSTTSRKPTENTSATETSTVISGHRFHPVWLVISLLVVVVIVVVIVAVVIAVTKFFRRMNQDESGVLGTNEAPAAPGTNGGEKIAQPATADNEEDALLYEGGEQLGMDEAPAPAPLGTNGGETIAQPATVNNEEYASLYEAGEQLGTDEVPAAAPLDTRGCETIAQPATVQNMPFDLVYDIVLSNQDGEDPKSGKMQLNSLQVARNNKIAVSLVQQSNDQQSTRPCCHDSPEGSTA